MAWSGAGKGRNFSEPRLDNSRHDPAARPGSHAMQAALRTASAMATSTPAATALSARRSSLPRRDRLPERWRGRDQFVVLETGFGLGTNFLATWQAWRDDPQRRASSLRLGREASAGCGGPARGGSRPSCATGARSRAAGRCRCRDCIAASSKAAGRADARASATRATLPRLVSAPTPSFSTALHLIVTPRCGTRVAQGVARCARPGAVLATYTSAPSGQGGIDGRRLRTSAAVTAASASCCLRALRAALTSCGDMSPRAVRGGAAAW